MLYDTLDDIAESIVNIAHDIAELASSYYDTSNAFLSSIFTSSVNNRDIILTHITNLKNSIKEVKYQISTNSSINLVDYHKLLTKIDKSLPFVRVALGASEPSDPKDASELDHYKQIEGLVLAYRSLILQFNDCILYYNTIHPSSPLTPFALADISAIK